LRGAAPRNRTPGSQFCRALSTLRSPPRRTTHAPAALAAHARIARDIGERAVALRLFSRALDLQRGDDPRQEYDLVEAVVVESAHSSMYVGTPMLELLARIESSPFQSPRMLRTRQLIRMRAGLQAGPQPHPLLTAASEQNLNPAYWAKLNREMIEPGGRR
jgi:hypothetical protein